MFVVDNIIDASKMATHDQRMFLYPISQRSKQVSALLIEQAEHYDTTNHLFDTVCGIRKKENEYKVIVKRSVFKRGKDES